MSDKTERNGARLLLDRLIAHGVNAVFGYPGGAVIPLYHEWVSVSDQIHHYRTAHEQHAVHAADGYARATGKTGVCIVTSGPGATNTVTGIATAFMDSIPMVIICGQVSSHLIGKDAFQEVDITSMTLAITKHNFLVRSVDELEAIIDKAFEIAESGRPGPVLIDIPKDYLVAKMPKHEKGSEDHSPKVACDFEPSAQDLALNEDIAMNEAIATAAHWLNEAKRPLVYCGGGVRAAAGEALLKELVDKGRFPVVNTLMGLGCYDRTQPHALGMVGMHGSEHANQATCQCDLLLALGVRFSDRVIGNPSMFAPHAKLIHIDLDPMEHHKNLQVDLTITGDVKQVLQQLMPLVEEKKEEPWTVEQLSPFSMTPPKSQVDWIFETLNDLDDGNQIYATDVGQHQMWSAQRLKVKSSRSWITSGGLGTMGFGLGAAIGAKIARPHEQVILITGDGSFRMNMQELSTLADYQLKVDILLFDNQALGMVKQWQTLFQNKTYAQTDVKDSIDYEYLCMAFGMKAFKADHKEALMEALKQAKACPSSTITVVKVPTDEEVYPIVPPGKGLLEGIYHMIRP